MNSISLESATAISEKHKLLDNIEDSLKLYTEESLTPAQSCASLLVLFARSIQTTQTPKSSAFGANVSSITLNGESCYQVRRDNSIYTFEEIPKVLLRALGCKPHNCHQNCINACVNELPAHAIIHTSEISFLPSDKTGLDGILHSYIQLGEVVFDMDLGIRMSKPIYDKLFNVKEISSMEARKVKEDYASGTIGELSKQKIPAEVYLMSRDDCAKTVSTGK